jgi:hypothetical protein
MPLFLLPALLAISPPICESRQEFFQRSDTGTLTLVSGAQNLADARQLYKKWCRVESGTTEEKGGDRMYFALNNRADEGGAPSYYVVKIFRRSRATELRPLLTLRHFGTWSRRRCQPGANANMPYSYTSAGSGAAQAFLAEVSRGEASAPCGVVDEFYANAFGSRDLSLADQRGFFLATPRRVKDIGLEKWSLNISAFSYGTVAVGGDRRAAYPVLAITRDGADEIIVQYVSSGSKYHEFRLAR